jgi:hypothetical protein
MGASSIETETEILREKHMGHRFVAGCLCAMGLCAGCESSDYGTRAAKQEVQQQPYAVPEASSRETKRQDKYDEIIQWIRSGGRPDYANWPGFQITLRYDVGPSRVESVMEELRTQFVQRHPELSNSPEITNAILAGQVVIGMKADQVIASIGTPSRIDRTATQVATHEQWKYDLWRPGREDDSRYLYFENSILVGLQDSGR